MEYAQSIVDYLLQLNLPEFAGLVFGLLCVYFLIKENILTWPFGIAYVIISFFIFWNGRLYGDFILHVFYLVLNIYGWYFWVKGSTQEKEEVPVTTLRFSEQVKFLLLSVIGIFFVGYSLDHIHLFFNMEEASLPYWDAATSALSITAMWLTARKKIENWYYWLLVDVLATGIYFYKELYFYSLLYAIYIGLAVAGYLAWKKSMNRS